MACKQLNRSYVWRQALKGMLVQIKRGRATVRARNGWTVSIHTV